MLASTRFREQRCSSAGVFLQTFLNVNETLKQKVDSGNNETLILFFFLFCFFRGKRLSLSPSPRWTTSGKATAMFTTFMATRTKSAQTITQQRVVVSSCRHNKFGVSLFTQLYQFYTPDRVRLWPLFIWNCNSTSWIYISFSLLEPTGCKRLTLTC